MDARWIASLAAEPPSVAEWEDLLLRMEIMGRALRVTLEEAPAGAALAAEALRGLVDREAHAAAWLSAASDGDRTEAVPAPEPPGGDDQRQDPSWLVERFVSLRARNFAMLQRRGLDVWAWTAALPPGETVTAHQVVTALVRLDTEALSALRAGVRLGAGAC